MNPASDKYPGYAVHTAASMAFAWDDQTAHTTCNDTPTPELGHCLWTEQELQLETS